MGDGPTKKQLRMVDAAIKKASAMVLSEDEGRVDSEGLKRMTRDYFGGSEVKASIVRIIFDGLRKAGGEPTALRKFWTIVQVLKVILLKLFKGLMQVIYAATRFLAGDAEGKKDIIRATNFDDLKRGSWKEFAAAYFKRFGLLGPALHGALSIVSFIFLPIIDDSLSGQGVTPAFTWAFVLICLFAPFSTGATLAGAFSAPLILIIICGIIVATWYVINQASKIIELTYEKVDDLYTSQYNKLMADIKDVSADTEKPTVAESIAHTIRRLNAVMA